jgi:hypothetical protein
MRIQRVILFVFGLILLAVGNGCATHALWKNDNLEAWNEPATDPHLRLFASKQPNDVLVVYDEYSERNDATHTRAYWLNQNQKLIDNRRAPHFVNADNAAGRTAIPVFTVSTNEVNLIPPYALVSTNGQSFALHLSGSAVESHDLPFYNDQKGKVEKLALMPLANVADVTILGGILGYIYLQGLAQSGASYSWHP